MAQLTDVEKQSLISVAATATSSVAFAWLASSFEPAPLVIIAAAMLAMALLFYASRRYPSTSSGGYSYTPIAQLAVLSLLVGALVAFVWTLPVFPGQRYAFSWGTAIQGYEFGAALSLAAISTASAIFRRQLIAWLVFLSASVGGMSIALSYLTVDRHDPLTTYFGWLVITIGITGIAVSIPSSLKLLAWLVGINKWTSKQGSSEEAGLTVRRSVDTAAPTLQASVSAHEDSVKEMTRVGQGEPS